MDIRNSFKYLHEKRERIDVELVDLEYHIISMYSKFKEGEVVNFTNYVDGVPESQGTGTVRAIYVDKNGEVCYLLKCNKGNIAYFFYDNKKVVKGNFSVIHKIKNNE